VNLRRHRGFTLIEILLALMIFSVVLVAIIEGIALQLRAQQVAEDTTRAVILAENILEQVKYDIPLENTEESGKFDGSHANFSYQLKIQETELAGLYEVQVAIIWEDGVAERSHVLKTLMALR
jgi:general secretion pathway protein I